MKKKVFALLLCGLPLMMNAQDAFDVLQMSQTELRGTSRFQSMAGAFGALGGDLSTMTQNPAGIGVYRSSDLGITFSLDCNSTTAGVDKVSQNKFMVNNVGYIGAIRLDSEKVPNLNFGFSYNRVKSFDRHYIGGVAGIPTSMSNYIADEFVNVPNFTGDDLYWTDDFNPYFDEYAPWAAITTFDMPTKTNGYVGIINDMGDHMQGLYGYGTTGNAFYEVDERGHADEYNISFGGNVANKFYFGLDFGIMDLDFRSYQAYEENLQGAYVMADDEDLFNSDIINNGTAADWGLYNDLHSEGTGVNFKLGFIWKPTHSLRLGAAFHTPTYYDMRDTYYVAASLRAYQDGNQLYSADKGSNDGYDYSSEYTIKTPWRFIGSVAGVVGQKGILSMDYEYVANQTMRVGDYCGHEEMDVTYNVKSYFKPSHIIRVGGEYRLDPNWSLRAGYSIKTTQVEKGVDNYDYNISTVGTNPAYQYDNTVQHITCGVGYHYRSFYTDLAYVHQIRKSVYNAFSPINDDLGYEPNVSADVKDNNNRFSLTLGVRF
ncbi:MAG: outer membrane protein transport protein [Muribaculaceae bacterium]|nr:outer membrane protein transport protein [Muribaculaceae bacterium]